MFGQQNPYAQSHLSVTEVNTTFSITLSPSENVSTTITISQTTANGSLSAPVSNSFVTYTPNNNFIGTDSFTYTTSNASGTSSLETVTIEIVKRSSVLSHPIGNVINGLNGDYLGEFHTSLSGDGKTMVVSSYRSDVGASNAGKAIIYRLINNIWTAIGDPIYGSNSSDYLDVTATNFDGTRVAVGLRNAEITGSDRGVVKVFELTNDVSGTLVWSALGQSLEGTQNSEQMGHSLDMNGDGSILAIGSNNYGNSYVYKYNGSSWVLLGNAISNSDSPELGKSISINDFGNRVVIGKANSDTGVSNGGGFEIYDYQNSGWVLSHNVTGTVNSAYLGYTVELSGDGNTVAAYSQLSDDGYVDLYRYDGSNWSAIWQSEQGQNDYYGNAISLSFNGDVLAIGGDRYDQPSSDQGRVDIYKFNGSSAWLKKKTISGPQSNSHFGKSLALNMSGSVIAIASPETDEPSSNSGSVRAYRLNDLTDDPAITPPIYVSTTMGQTIEIPTSIYDTEGDPITVSIIVPSSNATVTVSGTTFTYQPSNDFVGVDQITYQISDGTSTTTSTLIVKVYDFIYPVPNLIGAPIIGEAQDDQFGGYVSINADGSIIAISSVYNDSNGTDSGEVKIFQYSATASPTWQQIGNLTGSGAGENFGTSMLLNGKGNRLLVYDKLYEKSGSDWNLIHTFPSILSNKVLTDHLGETFLFSNESGTAYVYKFVNGAFTLPTTLNGRTFSMNDKGDLIAIGDPYNDTNASDAGKSEVFSYQNEQWIQQGSDLLGSNSNDYFGRLVELSGNGKKLFISADGVDINSAGDNFGKLIQYEPSLNASGTIDWVLTDSVSGTTSGFANNKIISNFDGNILLVDDITRLYKLENSALTTLVNKSSGSYSGNFAMSSDGSSFIIGKSDYSEGLSSNIGIARVFSTLNTINNAPTVGSINRATKVNTSTQFTLPAEDINGNTLSISIVSSPASGSLVSSGTSYIYTPNNNFYGTDTFTFKSSDGALESGIATATINVFHSYSMQPKLITSIVEESTGDDFSESIAIDGSGSTFAFGDYLNDGINNAISNSGLAKVFEVSSTQSVTQLGNDFVGSSSTDYLGRGIALNQAGNILAIGSYGDDTFGSDKGAVSVYEKTGVGSQTTWVQLGNTIEGIYNSGVELEMNASGKVLVVRENSSSERFRIFYYDGVRWLQISMFDHSSNGSSGMKLKGISEDGNRIVLSDINYDSEGISNRGLVNVYQRVGLNWQALGQSLLGAGANDYIGFSATLNGDGSLLAIGSAYEDQPNATGSDHGSVKVYALSLTASGTYTWTQKGSTLYGFQGSDWFGYGVSLDHSGKQLSVGAPNSSRYNNDAGYVQIFSFNNNEWETRSVIEGAYRKKIGKTVKLSADGTRLLVSGEGYSSTPGALYLYDLVDSQNNTPITQDLSASTQVNTDTNIYLPAIDPNNDALTFSMVISPTYGTVNITGNTAVYSPTTNYVGNDSFTYTASDGSLTSSSSTVSISVFYKHLTAGTQISDQISGTNNYDYFGHAVAINQDGSIIAAGSYARDITVGGSNQSNAGEVIVYQKQSNTASGTVSWVQLGNPIQGTSSSQQYGKQLAMSPDGKRIVVRNKVFEYTGGNWVQLGNDLSLVPSTSTNNSLAMNVHGNVVAVGNNSYVEVYSLSNGVWSKKGQRIDQESSSDYSNVVDLSYDGNTLAIGAYQNNGGGSDSGHVRVYHYQAGQWTQLGSDIDGDSSNDYFGISVSLSADASILAVGAHQDDSSANNNEGSVKVYQKTTTASGTIQWLQQGATLRGFQSSSYLGYDVSLDAKGTTLVAGAPNGTGYAEVFIYDGSAWESTGKQIQGINNSESFGRSVAISKDGTAVIVGGDNYNSYRGIVRVYDIVDYENNAPNAITIITATKQNSQKTLYLSGTDPDNDTFTASITSQPQNGTVSLTGMKAIYIPTTDFVGQDYFTFNLYDGELNSAVETATINVFYDYLTSPNQIGSMFEGSSNSDYLGSAVALNQNGDIAFFGASGVDTTTSDGYSYNDIGEVKAYKKEVNPQTNINSWVQMGSTINGATSSLHYGKNIAVSLDGKTMAIRNRVYRFINNEWIQIGGDLSIGPDSKNSLSINGDGSNVVIATSTYVEVYEYIGGSWMKKGLRINQEASSDYSNVVEISLDGNVLAIGAYQNDGGGNNAGHVRVFSYNGIDWVQIGDDLDGTPLDSFGISVALNYDGSILAVGSNQDDVGSTNTTNEGSVKIYQKTTTASGTISWTQQGSTLFGNSSGGSYGYDISLDDEGKLLAVGAYQNDLEYSNSGQVFLYRYENNAWNSWTDINGQSSSEYFGENVDLSADGTSLIVGMPNKNSSRGGVKIYDLVDYFNDAPKAISLVYSTKLNQTKKISLIGLDQEDNTITYSLTSTPTSGSVSQTGQTVIYTPNTGHLGQDHFTYTVSDGTSNSNSASVTINTFYSNFENVQQIANQISGTTANENFGYSTALSQDGNIIAIGDSSWDLVEGNTTTSNIGEVIVYQKTTNTASNTTSWTPIGNPIRGENEGDYYGHTLDISLDGSTLIVGGNSKLHAYKFTGGNWSKLGGSISALNNHHRRVSINADGSRFIVGNNGNYSEVYQLIGGGWSRIGQKIAVESLNNDSASSVAISLDGKTIAIGSHNNDGGGSDSGHVRLYSYNGSSWQQIGEDIDGADSNDNLGSSVSLNVDGSIVAIGANNDDNPNGGSNHGSVKVFEKTFTDVDGQNESGFTNYNVTNEASGNWVLSAGRLNGSQTEPTLTLYEGVTYTFVVDALGHPFYFTEDDGTDYISGSYVDEYTTGVTNSRADSGTVTFAVPVGAPSTLYYACGNHASMLGEINILPPSGTYSWTLQGTTLYGSANDYFGTNVLLDAAGTSMAVKSSVDGLSLFEYKNDKWESMSNNVKLYESERGFGLSGDGSKIIIGTSELNEKGPVISYNILDSTNDAPTAFEVFGASKINSNSTILLNATDPNGDQLSYSLTATPTHGTVSITGNQAVYTPNNNFVGIDNFSYVANDGELTSAAVTATIRVYFRYFPNAVQEGNTFTGENNYDYLGSGVAMSQEGNIIAIGSESKDITVGGSSQSNAGEIKVYQKQVNTASNTLSWVQMGSAIQGTSSSEYFGRAMAISGDGKTIVTHRKVYNYQDGNWVQLGNDLNITPNNYNSLAMSSDGKTIALGSGDWTSNVRVYGLEEGQWVQEILINSENGTYGNVVALSDDGKVLAIGATQKTNSVGYSGGQVLTYRKENGKWIAFGQELNGDVKSDHQYYGRSVSLNADGSILAVGANADDDPDNKGDTGSVKIYQQTVLTSGAVSWTLLGAPIYGTDSGSQLGMDTALDDSGHTLITGAYGNSSAQVYKYIDNTWKAIGSKIYNYQGSIDISADGTRAIVGYRSYSNYKGEVKVWDLVDVVNNTPRAIDLSVATKKNTTKTIRLFGYDPENSDLSFTLLSQPQNGTVSITASTATYTPTTDFVGNDTFSYHVSDGQLTSAVATVTLVVFYDYLSKPTIVGSEIEGLSGSDNLGESVAISQNGHIALIGIPNKDINTSDGYSYNNTGQVDVYQKNINTASNTVSWNLLGSSIAGPNSSSNYYGRGLASSADGKTVAVKNKVFRFVNGNWTQLGNDLNIEPNSYNSLSMNLDGTVVSVGRNSYVEVLEYAEGTWVRKGQRINQEASSDYSDRVGLSLDGNSIAIGAYQNDGGGNNAGHVRVFTYDGSAWNQVGDDIDGGPNDQLGYAVSLNIDGSILAIGSIEDDTPGTSNNEGSVSIFKKTTTTSGTISWVQMGDKIYGNRNSGFFGHDVSLDSDGVTLAVGNRYAYSPETRSGEVQLFRLINEVWTYWTKIGGGYYDYFGSSVELSDDGTTLIAGGSYDKGMARIYQLVDYENDAPVSQPLSVSTKTNRGIYIPFIGFDIENDPLTFSITSSPTSGVVSLTNEGVFYTPNTDYLGDDSYQYSVNDGSLTSSASTVSISVYFDYLKKLEPIGEAILNNASNASNYDYMGKGVAMNADGSVIAIGIPDRDVSNSQNSGNSAGEVLVYQKQINVVSGTTSWSLLGSPIQGNTQYVYYGQKIALAGNGQTIVVNDRVYRFVNGDWVQLGDPLTNPDNQNSIAISNDGNTIAIGSNNCSSFVIVYRFNGVGWVQIGDRINESSSCDYANSVALSYDGNVMAIGAHQNDGGASNSGQVRIFEYTSGSWTQMGGDIYGDSNNDYMGQSVSLNADGSILAVGSRDDDKPNSTNDEGSLKVFEKTANASGTISWVQKGATQYGTGSDFGIQVALDATGTILVGGANGYVSAFVWTGSEWNQSIELANQGSYYGTAIALAQEGTKLVVGQYNYDNGKGRVFNYNLVDYVNDSPEAYPYQTATEKGKAVKIYLSGRDLEGQPLTFSIVAPPQNGTLTVSGSIGTYLPNSGFTGTESMTYTASDGTNTSSVTTVEVVVFDSYRLIPKAKGPEFVGEFSDDKFGSDVAINQTGNFIIVGAKDFDGSDYSTGKSYMYQLNSGTTTWTAVGNPIAGTSGYQYTGRAVATNGNGTMIAVYTNNCLNAYQLVGGVWENKGCIGNNPRNRNALSMSYDGNTVVLNYNERVEVRRLEGTEWNLVGQEIFMNYDDYSVDISMDGSMIVIGNPTDDESLLDAGAVKVYELINNQWTLVGAPIYGEARNHKIGNSVAFNATGDILAIGGSEYDVSDTQTNAGVVYVYQLTRTATQTTWTALGGPIYGERDNHYFGKAVSLNHMGNLLAASSDRNNPDYQDGKVKIYALNDADEWELLIDAIKSESGNYDARSIELSGDGTTLVFGADEGGKGTVNVLNLVDYINDAPIAIANAASTLRNESTTITLMGSDPENDNITFNIVQQTTSGTISLVGSKTTYTPNTDFVGQDSFSFTVSDGSSVSSPTTVPISVFMRYRDVPAFAGDKITGTANGDEFGNSVAINADGTVIAVGAHYNDDFESNAGHVKIYKLENGAWTQKGETLKGQGTNWYFGRSVQLSGDGNVLMVVEDGRGSCCSNQYISLYHYVNSAWVSMGQALMKRNGEAFLSQDGQTVALGSSAQNSNKGEVIIYRFNGTHWGAIGSPIKGVSNNEYTGSSLALSADGKRIIIGASGFDNSGTDEGKASVYEQNGANWVKIGSDILGNQNYDSVGENITISSNGEVIAVCYKNQNAVGVYELSNGDWVLKGSLFNQINETNNLNDVKMSLDSEGDILTVVMPNTSGGMNQTGEIKLFSYDGSSWERKLSIKGKRSNQRLGQSMAISQDAVKLIIGDQNDPDTAGGAVQVYDLPQYQNTPPLAFNVLGATEKNTATKIYLLGKDPDMSSITFEIVDTPSSGTVSLSGNYLTYTPTPDFTGADTFSYRSFDGDAYSSTASITVNVFFDFLNDQKLIGTLASNSEGAQGGHSVASNNDGSIVVIGSPKENGTGIVNVYQFVNDAWVAMGSAINGSNSNERFGHAVDINAQGNRIAIGAPSNDNNSTNSGRVLVYELNNEQWEQKGATLNGTYNSNLGHSVALNAFGDILAVGAPYHLNNNIYNAGLVSVYNFKNDQWEKIGSDVKGSVNDERLGYSLSISDLGDIIAVGSPFYSTENYGRVQVFENQANSWIQTKDFGGNNENQYLGNAIDLNSDGSILAIASYKGYGNQSESGFVEVYQKQNTNWNQLGGRINGSSFEDQFGFAVSISDNGSMVAIGANKSDTSNIDSGHVSIYQWVENSWTSVGNQINGNKLLDNFGSSISLSDDGRYLFTGAPKEDTEIKDVGVVSAHQLFTNASFLAVSMTVSGSMNKEITGTLSTTGIVADFSYSITVTPTSGTATVTGDQLTYMPNTDFIGEDQLIYVSQANGLDSETAIVKIVVKQGADNTPPLVTSQSVSVTEQSSVTITLDATDPENDDLTIEIIQPKYGFVTFVYGVASNTSSASSTSVPSTNVSSTASSSSTSSNTQTNSPTGQQTPTLVYPFQVVYTSTSDTASFDTFRFIVNDGEFNSLFGVVSVTINTLNDPPVAYDQVVTDVPEETPRNIVLKGFDSEGSDLTYTITQPGNGTATLNGNIVTYTSGSIDQDTSYDQFTFTVNDGLLESQPGTVSISLYATNNPPVANNIEVNAEEQLEVVIQLVATDTDSDTLVFALATMPIYGTITIDGSTATYVSNSNTAQEDSFTFTAFDGEFYSNQGEVKIMISSLNDLPESANQDLFIDISGVVNINLYGSDEDGDALTYHIVDAPKYGSVSLTANIGTYTSSGSLLDDSFTYVVNDGTADSEKGTITISLDTSNIKGEDVIRPFNFMSANNDGVNDEFVIAGINLFPNNTLYIYDVRGLEVYKQINYGENGELFKGISNFNGSELPNGVYYFLLEYKDTDGSIKTKTGFIQLLR